MDSKALYERDSILLTLSKNRVVVDPRYRDCINDYLYEQYRVCKASHKIKLTHHNLGWAVIGEKEIFLRDQNSVNNSVSQSDRTGFRFRSGDEKVYKDFLRNTVYPVPTLALAMTLGYAAPVISRLQDKVPDLRTVIVNLCGASSTGKTTAEELLVSAFGCPTVTNGEGLIHPFFATTNAIYAGLEGINGLPIALDDTTANDRLDLHSLIYTLATGEEKARCNSDGTKRETRGNWSGLIAISSETPILENGNATQGQNVRVLQTQGITWTPDAETAELIKRTVRKHYGFTGYEFADYVGKLEPDVLFELYQQSRNRVREIMTIRDTLSDRLGEKYAAIHLTVKLMNDFFALKLDADALLTIMLAPEQENVAERDISVKGEMIMRNFILENRAHFDWLDDHGNRQYTYFHGASGIMYGTIRGPYDAFILTSQVENALKKAGLCEIMTIKKRWKERGLTVCDTGRYDCKSNGVRCIHFCFRDGIDYSPVWDDVHPPLQAETPSAPKGAPISTYSVDDEEAINEIFRGDE